MDFKSSARTVNFVGYSAGGAREEAGARSETLGGEDPAVIPHSRSPGVDANNNTNEGNLWSYLFSFPEETVGHTADRDRSPRDNMPPVEKRESDSGVVIVCDDEELAVGDLDGEMFAFSPPQRRGEEVDMSTTQPAKQEGDGEGCDSPAPTEEDLFLEDDLLSVMCDDISQDDLFAVGGSSPGKSDDWSYDHERTYTQNDADGVTSPNFSGGKKSRLSMSSSSSDRKGTSRSKSVFSRLGMPHHRRHHQSDSKSKKLCFTFERSGRCFRWKCPFVHTPSLSYKWKKDARHKKEKTCDQSILGEPPWEQVVRFQKLQQLQQMQLQQQYKQQHERLVHHMQEFELRLNQQAADHAEQELDQKQDYNQCLLQQQTQLADYGEMLSERLSTAESTLQSTLEEHLQALQLRVEELENSVHSQREIASHYRYITSVQEQQLKFIIEQTPAAAKGNFVRNGPTVAKLIRPDVVHEFPQSWRKRSSSTISPPTTTCLQSEDRSFVQSTSRLGRRNAAVMHLPRRPRTADDYWNDDYQDYPR